MKLTLAFLVAFLACTVSAQYNAPASEYPETLLPGLPFDCSQKPTGPNKDSRYMDVFHACVHGVQKKTYGCPQVGARFHYNEATLKCEGCPKGGCTQGQFYQPMQQAPPVPTNAPVAPAQPQQPAAPAYGGAPAQPAAPVAPVPAPQPAYGNTMSGPASASSSDGSDNSQDLFRLPESYTNNPCVGAPDGTFFPSTYANVFHRCVAGGVRKDFKCAKAGSMGQYDLWWDQALTQCNYPCLVQTQLPLFMSMMSPQQVQQLDRAQNGPLCNQSAAPAPQQPSYGQAPQAPAPAHPAQPGYGK